MSQYKIWFFFFNKSLRICSISSQIQSKWSKQQAQSRRCHTSAHTNNNFFTTPETNIYIQAICMYIRHDDSTLLNNFQWFLLLIYSSKLLLLIFLPIRREFFAILEFRVYQVRDSRDFFAVLEFRVFEVICSEI